MRHLALPAKPAEDKAVIAKLGKTPNWAAHLALWEQAYDSYQLYGGDPHQVAATVFGAGVGALQYALYDGRRNTKPFTAIRRQTGLPSCPMCGSSSIGTLDHYLPREIYGEFSIMRANLLPACTHCNSDEKGGAYKGASPARFIHPYYDVWADQPLWRVRIDPPYRAATFTPESLPGLASPQAEIVAFHLQELLGKQFQTSMFNWWATLADALRLRLGDPVSMLALTAQLGEELQVAEKTTGTNSWSTAAVRGLMSNADAIAEIYSRL